MEKSLRELVSDYRAELFKIGDLSPQRISEILVHLSNLAGNAREEVTKRHLEFNKKLDEIYSSIEGMSASVAKIKAECDQTWVDWQISRGVYDTIIELTRSIKFYLRTRKDEFEMSQVI